jgi:glycosyltransferase involved in cell wall biosynthesis
MIKGLLKAGINRVTCVCPRVLASYPRSKALWVRSNSTSLDASIPLAAPGFINLGPLKVLTQIISVALVAWQLSRKQGKPDAILMYNTNLGYAVPAYLLAKLWNVPVVPLSADLGEPGSWSFRNAFREAQIRLEVWLLRRATGLIVFSTLTVKDLGLCQPWLKIDPGIDPASFSVSPMPLMAPKEKIVMFSGTLIEASGIRVLLDAFSLLSGEEYKLWITGRGDLQQVVESSAQIDSRISYYGFVDRDTLMQLYMQATVLVNPRPSVLREHRYNFPSKLTEYLAVGRPVITTATSDVAQEYSNLTFLLHNDSPETLARLIQEVCSMPVEILRAYGKRAQEFVVEHKSWDVQARKVSEFLQSTAALSCSFQPQEVESID